eukprot:768593-Hanusia_phi.AAC.7
MKKSLKKVSRRSPSPMPRRPHTSDANASPRSVSSAGPSERSRVGRDQMDTLSHRCKRGASAAKTNQSALQDSEMNSEDLQIIASFKELLSKSNKKNEDKTNSSPRNQEMETQKSRNGLTDLDQTANSTSARSDDASELYQSRRYGVVYVDPKVPKMRRSLRSSVSQAPSNCTSVTTSGMDKELVEHLRKAPKSPFLPSSMYSFLKCMKVSRTQRYGEFFYSKDTLDPNGGIRVRQEGFERATVEVTLMCSGENISKDGPMNSRTERRNLCFIIKDGKPRVGAMEVVNNSDSSVWYVTPGLADSSSLAVAAVRAAPSLKASVQVLETFLCRARLQSDWSVR